MDEDLELSLYPKYTEINLRDWLAGHAPEHPQSWFQPDMPITRPEPQKPFDSDGHALNDQEINEWDKEYEKQRMIQWPYAWADVMIKERGK